MNIYKNTKIILFLLALFISTFSLLSLQTAYASTCNDGTSVPPESANPISGADARFCASHGGLGKEGAPKASELPADTSCATNNTNSAECKIFKDYLIPAINLLTGAVGILVAIMIIAGGIQYSASGGDAQGVNAAKKRIANAIFALLAFAFLWSFLQWIVPGGVF